MSGLREFFALAGWSRSRPGTVFGLGGNALDAAAVKKVFTAKARPLCDPLIMHVSSREMLKSLVASLPAKVADLFSAFMPGPLTLVLPKNATVPDIVTAGRDTVAVCFPATRSQND